MLSRYWITIVPLVAAFAPAVIGWEHSQNQSRRIEMAEASKLVYEGIKLHNPDATITNVANPYDRDFMYFQGLWPNPVGSPVIGNFAVNPWTGDVWDVGGCDRVSLPSIRRQQEGIRKRFQITKKEYARLQAKKPLCEKD